MPTRITKSSSPLVPVVALVGITAIWGLTFVLVKDAIGTMPPLRFLALRFISAGLILMAIFRDFSLSKLRTSTPTGIALALGYGLQTIGLRYTGATRSGFITGLTVVVTPVVGAVAFGVMSSLRVLMSVLLAGVGMFLLIGADLRNINLGDVLTFGCAIAFAFHLFLQAMAVSKLRPGTVASLQMLIAGGLFLFGSVIFETSAFQIDRSVLVALTVTAIGGSAAAFLVMAWAQKQLSPAQTAVILSAEPVFAGLAGFLILEERLSAVAWLGATLILVAMLAVSTVREPPSV